jgi:hypothetical protein
VSKREIHFWGIHPFKIKIEVMHPYVRCTYRIKYAHSGQQKKTTEEGQSIFYTATHTQQAAFPSGRLQDIPAL